MRRNRPTNSSPMWYTAAAEYALKRRKTLNRTTTCRSAWHENVVGQGNRLQQPQAYVAPCCRAAHVLENTSRSTRNSLLSRRAAPQAPQVVDLQIPQRSFENRNIIVTTWKNGSLLQSKAFNRPEIATQTDESLTTSYKTQKSSHLPQQSNLLPIIMLKSNRNSMSPKASSPPSQRDSITKEETAIVDLANNIEDVAEAAAIENENDLNIKEVNYKQQKLFPSLESNPNRMSPNTLSPRSQRDSITEEETAIVDLANNIEDVAEAAAIENENDLNIKEVNYKQQKLFPSLESNPNRMSPNALTPPSHRHSTTEEETAIVDLANNIEDVAKAAAIENEMDLNIKEVNYKPQKLFPSLESNPNRMSPNALSPPSQRHSTTEEETAIVDLANNIEDVAEAAAIENENDLNIKEVNYKPQKLFPSFNDEYAAANSSKVLNESLVNTCEVTEAHFISFDCDDLRQRDANQLNINSQKPQNGYNPNAYACYNNNDSTWRKPSFRTQQQLQSTCPNCSNYANCNYCYGMCSNQQQQTKSNGLTELQKQMQQAQAQINQMQLQLNNACGASRLQEMEKPAQATCTVEENHYEVNNAEQTIVQAVKCAAHAEPLTNNPQQRCMLAPPPCMSLGFYAIRRAPTAEPQRRCCGSHKSTSAASNRQSVYAPQSCPYQQQHCQHHCVHSAQFRSNNCYQPCCRQRCAQMRSMMPRCWQGH